MTARVGVIISDKLTVGFKRSVMGLIVVANSNQTHLLGLLGRNY